MKVISVYNRYLNRGGEDEVFELEARLLEEHGCTVTLVTEQVRNPRGLLESSRLAANAIWSRSWYRRFEALLKEKKPDVVHVHNVFPTISPSIYYACRKARVPVVQTLHNYRLICPASTLYRNGHTCEECVNHGLWRGVRYGCYRESRLGTGALALVIQIHRWRHTWRSMVDCYVALTEFSRQKMIAGGVPAQKIRVKPNFVLEDPGACAVQGKYALFVGRLAELKGVPVMIAAWRNLSQPVPLAIVGDGPFRPRMEQEIAFHRLGNVDYRGRLSRQDALGAMKSARFLVFPSEWYEGFPLTIVEAFACGLPVICSRLGSMQEIVSDGVTGLHFTAGDAQDLAAKVEWAWTHPEEMEIMGRQARAEYEAKYTADRNYEMLINIYQHAILAHEKRAPMDLLNRASASFRDSGHSQNAD